MDLPYLPAGIIQAGGMPTSGVTEQVTDCGQFYRNTFKKLPKECCILYLPCPQSRYSFISLDEAP